MALSKPRTVFGVHSVTPYRLSDKTPYNMARVVQGSTFSLEGDTVELKGGSNRFSWAIEDGDIDATLAFTVSEYPNWLFELFGGKAPTQGSAEPSGNLSQMVNAKGTSVIAATGLESTATAQTPSDLKMNKLVIKATGANEVKIYGMSDADFGRGTADEFENDDLLLATWSTISPSGTFDIPNQGIRLTAGPSATALVSGDTAVLDVRPVNTFNRVVKIGGIADEFPEFGAFIFAQKSASGALFRIQAYRLKAIGLGLGAERKQFAENEYSAKAVYDSVENAVCEIVETE